MTIVILGAEIGVQHDTANKSKTYRVVGHAIKAKYQRTPCLSIAPRFGVIFNNYMVYLKPSLEVSKDKAIFIDEDNDRIESSKKIKIAFAPGIGLERAFNNILARIEYNYSFGAKLRKKTDEGSASLKYTSHTVKLGIVYQV